MKAFILILISTVTVSVAVVAAQSGQRAAESKGSTKAAVAAPASQNAQSTSEAAKQRALMDKYCVTCHNNRLKTGNLELDKFDLTHVGEHIEIGEKVVRKLRAGMMPPSGAPRPDAKTLDDLVAYMEGELDHAAAAYTPPPGLHRMNRTEYTNAIRDILGVNVDASKFLPSDDSTRGFDNIAGALTVSPALMEAYLSAAGKIARLALSDVSTPSQTVYEAAPDTAQNYHVEGLPFGTRGGFMIKHQFPADGEFSFKVKGVTGYFQAVLGGVKGEQLEVMVDGERVHMFDWDRDISNTTGNGKSTPRIPISAGYHTVAVTFLQTNDLPGTELNRPFLRTMNTPGSIPGFLFYPHVGQVWIEGPFNSTGGPNTVSRNKIFVCHPEAPKDEAPCARTIISSLVKSAYRRPSTQADVTTIMKFYDLGRTDGGTFDDGIESALQRVLADPEFVYRQEKEPANVAVGKSYKIDDMALASRLSYFLWSSVPDNELVDLATQGKLSDPKNLEKQVKRMLEDPKSDALVQNFTGQWLGVRSLATSEPTVNMFPDFDDNLRAAYRKEIELFFSSIIHEDHNVLDMLTGNYTYVNERLAKQYGIPNVYGPQFRRVTLPANLDMRKGLLGKGAVLTITSDAARTSPVRRGKWFLETFLGVSPPDPPPGVDTTLKVTPAAAGGVATDPPMRVRMEAHRANAACAQCHKIFEPIGFALENFDVVGAWRTEDAGKPIDVGGVLVDTTKISSLADLRQALVNRSGQFERVLVERLMTYALGRGVEAGDMPNIRSIVRSADKSDHKFSSIIMGVVNSAPFQMNTKLGTAPAQRAMADTK